MIRQNECYLLVYDKIVNSDISEKFETHGAKLPINYSTGNSASWDISPLRLSDSQTLKIIEKGKVYTLEELSDYDLFYMRNRDLTRMVSHQRCYLEILRGR